MPEQFDIRHGQGVWRLKEANGVIIDIMWSDKEVIIEWYNSKTRDVLSFDDLYGNWDWKLKQWIITG